MIKTEDARNFNGVNEMILFFITLILRAAHASIFRSDGRPSKRSVPWWTSKCKTDIRLKRRAWSAYRRNKTVANYTTFKRARAIARRTTREAKKDCWRRFVSTINSMTPISKIWSNIHKIAGKFQRNSAPVLLNQGIKVGDPREVAELLAEHFSRISRGDHLSRNFLDYKLLAETNEIDFSTEFYKSYNEPFSMKELLSALSKCRPSAAGPDGMHYEFLKHLPEDGNEFLLDIFNTMFSTQDYPDWNEGTFLAFIKPGKTGYDPGDYRPIALTSCLCKLFERMVNARLQWYLESKGSLSPFQFGYRNMRSTTDALVALEIYIREAFAKNNLVISLFFDIEKAYDTTWRYHILKELHSEGLRGNLPIAIKNIIQNRTFKVRVGNTFSSSRIQYEGVPQGGVLSTTLFILAINKIGHNLPHGIRPSIYVDDYCVSFAGNNVDFVQKKMQEAIDCVSQWTERNGFKFSTSKTCAVAFSRRRVIQQPRLMLYGQPVQYKREAKFLGVIFDSRQTFLPHIKELKTACTQRLGLLKTLSHTTWGADRKSLLRIHEALVLSKLDYGSVVYGSALPSYLERLDPVHNSGLRISTGAFKSTPVKSLYVETGFYSLRYRREKSVLRYSLKTGSKYSPYMLRNINNISSMPIFETHPNYPKPFNIRREIIFRNYSFDFNVTPIVFRKQSPWKMPDIHFCKDLTTVKKKDTSSIYFRNIFYEHFSKHDGCIPLYTDGSKCEEGVGLSVVHPDKYISRRLPKDSSIFTAELYAILLALQLIMTLSQEAFVIVSDSLSALMALESFNPIHPIVSDIQEWFNLVTVSHKKVDFCWAPSHVGILGNEAADEKAKLAIRERVVTNKSLPYADYYPAIDKILKTNWQREWQNETQNKLFQIKSTVAKWSSSLNKNRQWEVILARLRMGHTRLTHGHLMEGRAAPICAHCNVQVTVKHILIDCHRFTRQHNRWFRYLDNNSLTLDNLLGESDKLDVNSIMGYLRDIGLLNKL